jgi:hypothetical protein
MFVALAVSNLRHSKLYLVAQNSAIKLEKLVSEI